MPEVVISEFSCSDLNDFKKAAIAIFSQIQNGDILLLSGPVGAGKTEFVKTIANQNQCRAVASPTFAFHHHYQGMRSFQHWDLYRIEDADELESTGFWDLIQNNEIFFIEWPEKLNLQWLPLDRRIYLLKIEIKSETARELVFSKID